MIDCFTIKIAVLFGLFVFLVVLAGQMVTSNNDYERRCNAAGGIVAKVASGWTCIKAEKVQL